MNAVVWILQIVLAVAFLAAGSLKLTQSKEKLAPRMGWVNDFSDSAVRGIGAAEVLGALGLILPSVTKIAPVLTPIAAVGLALTMVGAIITHVRRKEIPMAVPSLVLLIISVIVAVERFGPHKISS